MTRPILVTGATGDVGREVVSGLLDAGVAVRAMVRDPEFAGLAQGVEIVRGDLSDPASVPGPGEGASAVFLVSPFFSMQMIGELATAVIAVIARRAPDRLPVGRVGRRAGLALGAPRAGSRGPGVEWTMLQPTGFATNARFWADQIRGGDVVRWVYGAGATLADPRARHRRRGGPRAHRGRPRRRPPRAERT